MSGLLEKVLGDELVAQVRRQLEEQRAGGDFTTVPGTELHLTCVACPVQYEGEVDGNPAYFRARGKGWTFTIVAPGSRPVLPGPNDKVLYRAEGAGIEVGDLQNAGWMAHRDAVSLITVHVRSTP